MAISSRCLDLCVRTALPLVLIGSSVCAAMLADELPAKTGDGGTKEISEGRESIDLAARQYKLFLGNDRIELEMEREPVLRWPNPTRKTSDGATFVWTRDGRPEAIVCLWKYNDAIMYAFQSLSASSLVAEYGQQPVWHPRDKGITLGDLTKAPPPADSPAKRLSQMRDLARRFHCRLINEKEDLRLLPSPIYRYKTARAEVFDGALFAYAQGTDPEVVLVLEAQRRGDQAVWKYALTRRSATALEADLDGRPIWSMPSSIGSAGDVWVHGFSPAQGIAKSD